MSEDYNYVRGVPDLDDEIKRLRAQQAALVEALTELVRLKDLKDWLGVREAQIGMLESGIAFKEKYDDYYQCKPKAWAAARAALAQGEG